MDTATEPSRPRLTLRYDLRATEFGRDHRDIYGAMLEQVRWADDHGFDVVVFSEHHGAEDGYLPSPLVAVAGAAGATSQIKLRVSALILPLYDIVRLAEDLAVLDLLSNGRVDLVIGAGYRPEEYELHDRSFPDRFGAIEEGFAVLRGAWSGTPFEHRGRRLRVTPDPLTPGGPRLLLGGSSTAAARRAARIADGFMPVSQDLVPAYLEACADLGREPGLTNSPPKGAKPPMFLHVSDDPERAWHRIAPHALHEANSYGRWLSETGSTGPYEEVSDAEALRASGAYSVVTPDECVELVRSSGVLGLHPLMGGLDPELAAESLGLIESSVLPRLSPRHSAAATS